jgi:hypothetical protein
VTAAWSRVDDLVATLRARWDRGTYLRAYAAGEPWVPVVLAVKGPTAADLVNDLDGSLRWLGRFHADSRGRGGQARFTIDYRPVRSRALGDNKVPARIRVDTLDQLAALLGTSADIARLDRVLGCTGRDLPGAAAWVAAHPVVAVANHDVWPQLVSTVRWIVDHDTSRLDVRHLDVPGVDTKFVERHRKVLGPLLDQVLPPERVDQGAPSFAARYNFRRRPSYLRLRLLAPVPTFPATVTEVQLRVDELAATELPVDTVFIVENQATYLAFPSVPGAVVVFGEGFGTTVLEAVAWLRKKQLVYWGDIDTHGFAILHRLRERVPSVRSLLMDRATLLAHREQIVGEPTPTSAPLESLTPEEQELYRDLIEDRYGPSVRLEQERIRFSLVRQALEPWLRDHCGDKREPDRMCT